MRISISRDEYLAIHFAIDQIETDREGSDNEEWNELADEALKRLYSIDRKYGKALGEAYDLNEARRFVKAQNRNLVGAQIDKVARRLLRIQKDRKHGNVQ